MMRRAYCLIRTEPHYRQGAFIAGLKRCGLKVFTSWPHEIRASDVLVIWNRYDCWDTLARQFEAKGATVLVVENGYMGVDWLGQRWYAISRNWHNGRGTWSPGDSSRWDSFGFELAPPRPANPDGYALLLPQRGFGPPETAMPRDWVERVSRSCIDGPVKVRQHPGNSPESVPLGDDLAGCRYAVTHGSGAGIKALAMGYPVFSTWEHWIGFGASDLELDEGARYQMFCNLAWAMWRTHEIESGEALRRLL
jgi:hypothetical protein